VDCWRGPEKAFASSTCAEAIASRDCCTGGTRGAPHPGVEPKRAGSGGIVRSLGHPHDQGRALDARQGRLGGRGRRIDPRTRPAVRHRTMLPAGRTAAPALGLDLGHGGSTQLGTMRAVLRRGESPASGANETSPWSAPVSRVAMGALPRQVVASTTPRPATAKAGEPVGVGQHLGDGSVLQDAILRFHGSPLFQAKKQPAGFVPTAPAWHVTAPLHPWAGPRTA
jgi:hypothetical protein